MEKIKEILELFKKLPSPWKHILSAILGAIVALVVVSSCTACGTSAYLRTNSNGTITITNTPSTSNQIDAQIKTNVPASD